jgi:ATP-dependent DNA helicase RecQ
LRAAKKPRKGKAAIALPPDENDLFETLRALRKRLSDEQGVPPYTVFSDATLRELASVKPRSQSAFRAINGVGDVKLERYGEIFVSAIRDFVHSIANGSA